MLIEINYLKLAPTAHIYPIFRGWTLFKEGHIYILIQWVEKEELQSKGN